jgi:hypothetical protein
MITSYKRDEASRCVSDLSLEVVVQVSGNFKEIRANADLDNK